MSIDDETKTTHGVGSARRALQLLLAFTPESPRHTPADLAVLLGLPMGSIYRYTALFRELGMLEDGPGSQLQLTPRILPTARAAMVVQNAVAIASPFVHALALEVGESVMLTRQAGNVAVCMLSIPSPHALRLDFPVGHIFEFGAGATTRMLLAMMSDDERQRRIEVLPQDAQPDLVEIDRTGARGWSTSEQELEPGVWACAVGLGLVGQPPMTITVAGPEFRLSPAARERIIERAAESVAQITAAWLSKPVEAQPRSAETISG
ncbi:IclR family transcriptional regulator [Herbiconiux sp. VKM Ac-1786]|uniref:IclR family transcriptional regulator n=1 Tax=Herbiconiux sp. VKM Ac-1786 TaxID=2783824 RepID=UPI00351C5D48